MFYTNTGDEDDRDLSRVGMSLEMFRAYTEGYLSQRAGQLNQAEIDHLPSRPVTSPSNKCCAF